MSLGEEGMDGKIREIEERQIECDLIYDNYLNSQSVDSIEYKSNVSCQSVEKNFNKTKTNEESLLIGIEKDDLLKNYWDGNRPFLDESANDMGFMSKLMYWSNNDINLSIKYFIKSPYSKTKDHEHLKKQRRMDYLKRTAERCKSENVAKNNSIEYIVENKKNKSKFSYVVVLDTLYSLEKAPYLYSNDDKGNAELFANVYKDKLRFDITINQWRYYNGRYWDIDGGGVIASDLAKVLQDALIYYLADDTSFKKVPEEQRYKTIDEFRKHILTFGKKSVRDNMIKDAKDRYPIKSGDLDKDEYLLNCQNGTLNLRTFEFANHNPNDLLSKITNVSYNPNVSSKLWEKFITSIMCGDKEKIEYLQKSIGYSLTGNTSQEKFFIAYGATSRNGKSTFINTIAYMLGETNGYSAQVNPESFTQKQNKDSRSASGDIARLENIRFVSVSEPQKRMVLDVSLIKSLTGGDIVTARHLYTKEFQFVPKFKIFFNTNYLPQASDDTVFSSRRVNVIPFEKHFTEEEQDRELKEKLRNPQELSGILNWAIVGLKMFNNDGLISPKPIVEATKQYREDNDKIGLFIKDCLIESNQNITAQSVYIVYEKWCESNGYKVENRNNFYSELRTKNLLKNSATIDGKTQRNVVCGFSINSLYQSYSSAF